MNTIMIVGCGSIGQRHAKNAKKLGVQNVILCDICMGRLKEFAAELGTNYFYASYHEALKRHPETEAAIISTPSAIHVEPATFFAQNGVPIFVEKPLSNNLDGVDPLIEITGENNVVAMMGQSYRFHEGFIQLKSLLDENIIGKIYHVNYQGGHYLPDWHHDQDYRKEYVAQKRLGGGVLLTSTSHSFDTVQWLFGNIKTIQGWKTKLSHLEIDVEDSVFCLANTEYDVVVICQSDFIQRKNRHEMLIVGKNGHIKADFIKNQIEIFNIEKVEKIIEYDFNPNQRYVEELIHFFKLIENGTIKHDLDLNTGYKVLELIKSREIIQLE
jgi:predicted dehydrogenase